MKILSVHQPQYIPWLGYFDKIARSDCFVFLDDVQYKVREFQNRNKIRTHRGWAWLTVPVFTKGRRRQKIKEVLIDNERPWQRRHEHTLMSCYGNALYFSEHREFLKDVYSRTWLRLVDLNLFVIKYTLHYTGIATPLVLESEVGTSLTGTGRIIELCKKMNCDAYLSGIGGRDYLRQEEFSREGIRLIYQEYVHPVYQQLFVTPENGFLPFMSALDLLFNEGPRSREILKI